MDFAFSEEQELLRASARGWLRERYPTDRVAALAESPEGWDPASWPQLRTLGWLDPDLGMLEYAVLAEEAGYALYPGPWWSTIALAAPILGSVPEQPTTLAWAEPGAPTLREATAVETVADDRSRLTGSKLRVPDGTAAGAVLVVAAAAGGVGIWRIEPTAGSMRAMSTMDSTRRLAALTLDGVPASSVIAPGEAAGVLSGIRRRALALLACEAVGIAQRALDLSSAYATERQQFGRPIGSYQAVSHRIADIFTALQLARSLAYRAVWCVHTDAPDADEAVACAAVSAGQGAVLGCEAAIQAMGGIAFTWEHPLHRFYKRAQWIAAFDGTPAGHRADLATTLLG